MEWFRGWVCTASFNSDAPVVLGAPPKQHNLWLELAMSNLEPLISDRWCSGSFRFISYYIYIFFFYFQSNPSPLSPSQPPLSQNKISRCRKKNDYCSHLQSSQTADNPGSFIVSIYNSFTSYSTLDMAINQFLFISIISLVQPQELLQPATKLRNLQKWKTHNIKIHRTKYLRYKIKNVIFFLFLSLFFLELLKWCTTACIAILRPRKASFLPTLEGFYGFVI